MRPHVLQKVKILSCLLLVSASWGSCFMFIALALKSFPPFLLSSIRLGIPGILLFSILYCQGKRNLPTFSDIKRAAIVSFFMVFCGAGIMTFGQQFVPSGTVALFMGSTPLWMVLSGWLILKEKKPSRKQQFGLVLGSCSIIALCIDQGSIGMGSAFGMFCLILTVLGWVAGSIYTKLHEHDTNLTVMQSTAVMLIIGGFELIITSFLSHETFYWHNVGFTEWIAVLCLIFFGGLTAYSCYFWLLSHTTTAIAISYDYVNPIIGIFLGWFVVGETVGVTSIVVCIFLIIALYFVITGEERI